MAEQTTETAQHEHDAAGCLDCECWATPMSSRTPCTCPPGVPSDMRAVARPVEQEIADVLAEHDWRWAIRDSQTGHGVRIACTAVGCEWSAERVDETDDVWREHRLHQAAALAPLIARERAAAAREALKEAADAVERRDDSHLLTVLLAMECNGSARMVADWIEEMLRDRADRIGGDPS